MTGFFAILQQAKKLPFNGDGHSEVNASSKGDLRDWKSPWHQVEIDPRREVSLAELRQAEDQDHEDDVGLKMGQLNQDLS